MEDTYNLTNDIGKVRLLIGDTDIADTQFSDEEITAFLTMGGSVNIAAALALESWAATLTDSALSEKIGDYAYSKKAAANKLDLAARLRGNEATIPVSDWAEMDLTCGSGITAEED